MKVWDRPVRLLHWSLAVTVMAAWFTGGMTGLAHEVLGYMAGAIVLARAGWGFAGNRFARFSNFVRSPVTTLAYLKDVATGRAARYIGHNPLGGWMVILLLTCVAALTISGVLYTTDLLWGYEWLYRLHAILGWAILALVVVHVLGVVFTSWQHGENLVKAMITGDKPEPGNQDVA